MIADLHCDTIGKLYKQERNGSGTLRSNKLHLDLLRMKEAGCLLQNFALFINLEACEDAEKKAWDMLAFYEEELKSNAALIAPAYCSEDIKRNHSAGKMSALLTIEEGAVLKGDVRRLRRFFERGVRMITLTWNYPNEIGFPNVDGTRLKGSKSVTAGEIRAYLNTPDKVRGLTKKGFEMVEAMEELGIIPDVSHLSDAGFYDVAACTKKPFTASHSNARAICPAARNLTDDMLRLLGERGGVAGLNYCPDFLTEGIYGEKNPGTIAAVAAHARHMANTAGIEAVALGSDFDGIEGNRELPGVQAVPLLADALKKAGFHSSECDKIFFENVIRLYGECLPHRE